jgi:hypothetical protein
VFELYIGQFTSATATNSSQSDDTKKPLAKTRTHQTKNHGQSWLNRSSRSSYNALCTVCLSIISIRSTYAQSTDT